MVRSPPATGGGEKGARPGRRHAGLDPETGRLRPGYRYTGARTKTGLAEIGRAAAATRQAGGSPADLIRLHVVTGEAADREKAEHLRVLLAIHESKLCIFKDKDGSMKNEGYVGDIDSTLVHHGTPGYDKYRYYYISRTVNEVEVLLAVCECSYNVYDTLTPFLEITKQQVFTVVHICNNIDFKGAGRKLLNAVLEYHRDDLVAIRPAKPELREYYFSFGPTFPENKDADLRASNGWFMYGSEDAVKNILLINFYQILKMLHLKINAERWIGSLDEIKQILLNIVDRKMVIPEHNRQLKERIDNLEYVPASFSREQS